MTKHGIAVANKGEVVEKYVWVFTGESGVAVGVFAQKGEAEMQIEAFRLTGMLTRYPVGMFAIDWAMEKGSFTPKSEESLSRKRGSFTSASMEHYHYEEGHES